MAMGDKKGIDWPNKIMQNSSIAQRTFFFFSLLYSMLVFATSSGQAWLIFVLRKKESKMKKIMKEEGLEKGECGPPARKVFFETVGLEPSDTYSPRWRESNALAGYTSRPSSVCSSIFERVWLFSVRWSGTAWFKSDKLSKKKKDKHGWINSFLKIVQ